MSISLVRLFRPPGAAAGKLSATAHADARFQTAPTTLKLILTILSVLLIAASAVTAMFLFRGNRSRRQKPTESRWRRVVPTALVFAVMGGWAFLGPLADDDGFYTWMARNFSKTGFIGNYYTIFNASE